VARSPLLARMSLDEVRCNEEGDGFGSAEPYLWTMFFKIDGDSVIVGDDTHLKGECTIVASAGYAALADYVRQAINNDIIPSLYLYKQDVSDDEISKLVDEAFDAVNTSCPTVVRSCSPLR
jgi:hypothetical protein